MIQKFECWNCKCQFSADDKEWVECPHCHSDNVEYSTFHTPKWVFYAVPATAILCAASYCAFDYLSHREVKQEIQLSGDTETESFVQEANQEYLEDGNTIEPSISIGEIVYNDDDNTYTCRFDVAYPPQKPWNIIIMSYYGDKEIAKSEDGVFKDLPYSKDDGFYRVKLVDASTGELLCEERDFPDFGKQINIKKPWTAADLQKAINSKTSLVDNPYIDSHHEVIVVNKPAGDTSETSSVGQVQDLLQMCGMTAKVISVEHNNLNQVSLVKISIDYPSDWLEGDDE